MEEILTELRAIKQRLGAIENGHGHSETEIINTNTQKQTSRAPLLPTPETTQTDKNTPTHRENMGSTNRDYQELIHCLFKSLQLKHHQSNWTDLPNKIAQQIDTIFENIVPPMPDRDFHKSLQEVRNSTKTNILLTVQEHISKKQDTIEGFLVNLNPEDAEYAGRVAKERFVRQTGRKRPHQVINKWLLETFKKVEDTQRIKASYNVQAQENVNDNWVVATTGRKRKATVTTPTTISLSNRFTELGEEGDETDRSSEEEFPPLQAHTAPAHKRTNNRSSPYRRDIETRLEETSHDSLTEMEETSINSENIPECSIRPVLDEERNNTNTAIVDSQIYKEQNKNQQQVSNSQPILNQLSKPIIHTEDIKANWNLKIKPQTKTIVLADSNFRLATQLPADWEIHVYPGANITNIHKLIKSTPIPETLKTLIIAVGINNKAWAPASTTIEINKLFSVTERLHCATHYVGVSIPSGLNEREKNNINFINKYAEQKCIKNFIKPLNDHEVSVSPNDSFKIHYDQNTINKICTKITRHFLVLSPGRPRKFSL